MKGGDWLVVFEKVPVLFFFLEEKRTHKLELLPFNRILKGGGGGDSPYLP